MDVEEGSSVVDALVVTTVVVSAVVTRLVVGKNIGVVGRLQGPIFTTWADGRLLARGGRVGR